MEERTVNICGKDVRLRYCSATETGFEDIAGKPIGSLDAKRQRDILALCSAAIVAAYSRNDENAPITSKDILYEATPEEIVELAKAVFEMRNEWYHIPKVVDDIIPRAEGEGEKN